MTEKKEFLFFRVKDVNKLLFLLFFFLYSLAAFSQSNTTKNKAALDIIISFHFQDVELEKVLEKIANKYNVKFTYVNNNIPLEKKVTATIIKQPLEAALKIIFKDTHIEFKEIGSQILLQRKEEQNQAKSQLEISKRNSVNRTGSDSLTTAKYKIIQKKKFRLSDLFSFSFHKRRTKGNQLYFHNSPKDTSIASDTSKRNHISKPKPQKIKAIDPNVKRWQIGVFYSPEMSFKHLKGDNEDAIERKNIEKGKPSYSFGTFVRYYQTSHFFIQTGISYMSFRESGTYMASKPYLPPIRRRPENFKTDTSISYHNQYNYFSVPLTIGYKLGQKLNFTFQAGFIVAIFFKYKSNYPSNDLTTTTYPNDYIPNPEVKPAPPALRRRGLLGRNRNVSLTSIPYYYRDYLDPLNHEMKKICLVYTFSIEGNYQFSQSFGISLSLNFKYFISSIYDNDEDMKQRPYSLGISFAGIYKF